MKSSPEQEASFLSKLLFLWVAPLVSVANKKTLDQDDLWAVPPNDKSKRVYATFQAAYDEASAKENATKKGIFVSALIGVLGKRFFIFGFLARFLNSSLQFTFPIFLSAVIEYIEDGAIFGNDVSHSPNLGYVVAAGLGLAMVGKAICENAYFHIAIRGGWQMRSAVTAAVYQKSLRLSAAARQEKTLGEMVNYMQIDGMKLEMFAPQIHVLWDGIYQIIGYMAVLITYIGPSALVGLVVMVLSMPLQLIIMKRLFGMNRIMAKHTDARVKVVNEALQGMQCVKMYSWEENFLNLITGHRSKEVSLLKKQMYLRAFSRAYMGAVPVFCCVASFVVFAVTEGEVRASTLFAALAAFGQLRFPLLFYPMAFAQLAQAKVSVGRVSEFLSLEEVKSARVAGGDCSVSISNATYWWENPSREKEPEKDEGGKKKGKKKSKAAATKPEDANGDAPKEVKEKTPTLQSIDLSISKGSLVAIVGRVGSGKSSLVNAILGEMHQTAGKTTVNEDVAYAAQQPWILNATIRDNVLFGEPYDEEKYRSVLRDCQMEHDLELLGDGDMTMIGERGINLSGGQKQRVSLARAAYSSRPLVVMDDPLSALDPEVSAKVFDKCIRKRMDGRTRILVTNQMSFLKYCDSVVVLENGSIVSSDASEIINSIDGDARERKNSVASAEEADEEAAAGETTKAKPQELMEKEEIAKGAVPLAGYVRYLKAGGGLLAFSVCYFAFMSSIFLQVFQSYWISMWSTDATPLNGTVVKTAYSDHTKTFYLVGYALLAFVLAVVTYVRTVLLARIGVSASKKLHEDLTKRILKAPTSFFDTTPTGRIVSRFSKDVHSMDEELSNFFDFFLFCSLYVVATLATIGVVTPYFLIAVLPLST